MATMKMRRTRPPGFPWILFLFPLIPFPFGLDILPLGLEELLP
jgi:hypothetical protein